MKLKSFVTVAKIATVAAALAASQSVFAVQTVVENQIDCSNVKVGYSSSEGFLFDAELSPADQFQCARVACEAKTVHNQDPEDNSPVFEGQETGVANSIVRACQKVADRANADNAVLGSWARGQRENNGYNLNGK